MVPQKRQIATSRGSDRFDKNGGDRCGLPSGNASLKGAMDRSRLRSGFIFFTGNLQGRLVKARENQAVHRSASLWVPVTFDSS